MSYYWFNRQELLQKAKNKYLNCGGKEKVAEYYIENKEFLKENAKNSENRVKIDDVVVNKKEFHASKKPIALNFVVISVINSNI